MKDVVEVQNTKENDVVIDVERKPEKPCIFQTVEIEELAVDGICGIY